MGEMVDFGKDLAKWDKQKDTSDAQFIVTVLLVLLDKEGNALQFSGKITNSTTLLEGPTGPTLGHDFKCLGTFGPPSTSPGVKFPGPGGTLTWSCRDTGSKGKIQPESSSALKYDFSDFQLVDKFLLAKGKELQKGTPARATIWFNRTISSGK